MQVAQIVGSGVVHKVLDLVLTEISNFANIYSGRVSSHILSVDAVTLEFGIMVTCCFITHNTFHNILIY